MNRSTKGTQVVGELLVGGTGALTTGARYITNAGYPVNGASGTGAGRANPGSICVDTTNGFVHQNVGTLASPIWVMLPATARLAITNAQAKAIRATPLTIVGAPGVGRMIVPIAGYVGLVYGGTNAFTSAANDVLGFKYKDGTTAALMSGGVQAFMQATANSMSQFVPAVAAGASVNITKANSENQPLVVHNITASEIAGNAGLDNTLVVVVTFTVIASGL